MTRGRARAIYFERIKSYMDGITPIGEGNPISSDELEDGLPGHILGSLDY